MKRLRSPEVKLLGSAELEIPMIYSSVKINMIRTKRIFRKCVGQCRFLSALDLYCQVLYHAIELQMLPALQVKPAKILTGQG